MSTPTPAEIQKARAIVECEATHDAAAAAAARLIVVANAVQGMIARTHYNNASQDLADDVAAVVETFKRANEAREALWAIQEAEEQAVQTAVRAVRALVQAAK